MRTFFGKKKETMIVKIGVLHYCEPFSLLILPPLLPTKPCITPQSTGAPQLHHVIT